MALVVAIVLIAGVIVPKQSAEADYAAVKGTLEEYSESTLDLNPASDAVNNLKQSGAYDLLSDDERALIDDVSTDIDRNSTAYATYDSCVKKHEKAKTDPVNLLGEESACADTLNSFENALKEVGEKSRYYQPINDMRKELTELVESAKADYAAQEAAAKAKAAGCESSAKLISFDQTITENDKCEFSISRGEWVDSFKSDAFSEKVAANGYRLYVVRGAFKNLGSIQTSRLEAKIVFNGKYTYETRIYYQDGNTSGGIAQPMANYEMTILCSVPEDVASNCTSIAANFYIRDQIDDYSYMSAKNASYAIVL